MDLAVEVEVVVSIDLLLVFVMVANIVKLATKFRNFLISKIHPSSTIVQIFNVLFLYGIIAAIQILPVMEGPVSSQLVHLIHHGSLDVAQSIGNHQLIDLLVPNGKHRR